MSWGIGVWDLKTYICSARQNWIPLSFVFRCSHKFCMWERGERCLLSEPRQAACCARRGRLGLLLNSTTVVLRLLRGKKAFLWEPIGVRLGEWPRAICSAQWRWRCKPKPCLVFKAAGFNALIHEGTGYTDRVAHDYKSSASKLLGGNNTDQRGAYVYIQRASAQDVCVCILSLKYGYKRKCNLHA